MNIKNEITVYLEIVEFNGSYEVDAILDDGRRKEIVPLTSYERALKLGKISAESIEVNLKNNTKRSKKS